MLYYVYILECSDKSLYTGCTNNLKARVIRHNLGQGAKYTRARLPAKLVYFEKLKNYSLARKREAQIHRWRREEKLKLIRFQRIKPTNH